MFYHRICNLKMPSFMGEMSDGLISHQSKSHQKYITRSGVPRPSLANITVLSLPGSQSLTSFSSSRNTLCFNSIKCPILHNCNALPKSDLVQSMPTHFYFLTYPLDGYSFRTNNRFWLTVRNIHFGIPEPKKVVFSKR